MELTKLQNEIDALPLDVRMDFLTKALASARTELYGLDKRQWQDSINNASVARLAQRLAALDLPCWSAVEREDSELPRAL